MCESAKLFYKNARTVAGWDFHAPQVTPFLRLTFRQLARELGGRGCFPRLNVYRQEMIHFVMPTFPSFCCAAYG